MMRCLESKAMTDAEIRKDAELFNHYIVTVNKLLCCSVYVCQKHFKNEAENLVLVREKRPTWDPYFSLLGHHN